MGACAYGNNPTATCVVVQNKWALGMYGFRFPFLLTSAHSEQLLHGCMESVWNQLGLIFMFINMFGLCSAIQLPRPGSSGTARAVGGAHQGSAEAGQLVTHGAWAPGNNGRRVYTDSCRWLQWKGVLYIGGFMALNIALNNISLLDISLTLNQIIR